jgi:regulatory protein
LAAGLSALARRAFSRDELRRRLLERHDADEVEAALARMGELGLLDDLEYARTFVRDRFERRGYGRVRIASELGARGVAAAEAAAAIEEVVDAERERERAASTLERYLARRGDQARAREGAYRHLTARGFPADLVRDLLGVYL